jgi:hypothetical protein
MRTRAEVKRLHLESLPDIDGVQENIGLILELLLDIRDLLIEQAKKSEVPK